jgi:hypothetical protein
MLLAKTRLLEQAKEEGIESFNLLVIELKYTDLQNPFN